MTFKRGISGNPNGRPKGSRNRRSLIACEFEKAGSQIAKAILEKAKEGDLRAADIVLQRLEPPLKPEARRVEFQFDPDASIADQAKAVMTGVAEGRLDPETAKLLIDMLSAVVGLKDVETFLAELRKLRESKRPVIPGGVVVT
jgi:hypothetical protein